MVIPQNFGRREAPDARDKNFPMKLRLDPLREEYFPKGIPPGTRHYWSGPILNQKATGTCVAHGWAAKVRAAPIMQQMTIPPYDFYRQIVQVDEFPDNDHEATGPDSGLQGGTTVRAGAKTLVTMGYAKSYLWAESAEDVRAWILSGFGGVVIGVKWFEGMRETDADGFLSPTGGDLGGHCTYLNGWSDRAKRGKKNVPATRGQNSWGGAWGQKGRFWLSMEDLDALIKDGGEACALTEARVGR